MILSIIRLLLQGSGSGLGPAGCIVPPSSTAKLITGKFNPIITPENTTKDTTKDTTTSQGTQKKNE